MNVILVTVDNFELEYIDRYRIYSDTEEGRKNALEWAKQNGFESLWPIGFKKGILHHYSCGDIKVGIMLTEIQKEKHTFIDPGPLGQTNIDDNELGRLGSEILALYKQEEDMVKKLQKKKFEELIKNVGGCEEHPHCDYCERLLPCPYEIIEDERYNWEKDE